MGERLVGDWAIGTHIGSGSFAIVWRAKHRLTGQEAAVKEIALDKLNGKLRQSLESEVSILKRINHDNIVKLLEVFEEKSKLYLIMEFCSGGDLAHYIRAHRGVPEATAQHFMQQLAAGLKEMWAHHLVHRDLKPQNLLLDSPGPGARLKIADFGFARLLQPQGLAETLCGSPLYMAPEILHFHKYDAKADLWSVGAILFELVAGRPPFNGANQFQLLRNIDRGEARLPDSVAGQLSMHCRQLIHSLLRRNPVERISFEEFFRHPFLTEPAPAPPPSAFPPALPGLGRSASANAIPQQVLGFNEQPRRANGNGEGGGGGNGAPAQHAVVPPGQLSNQLKPRRSLDLDGIAQHAQRAQQLADGSPGPAGTEGSPATAADRLGQAGGVGPPALRRDPAAAGGLAAQLAALASAPQQQQQQQQQLSGQGNLLQQGVYNGWGPVPLQAGSQPRQAGFVRPPQRTPHGSAPPVAHTLMAGQPPFGAAAGPRRPGLQPAAQQQAAAQQQRPGPRLGVPAPAEPPPPRPASAAAAGRAAVDSTLSIDDDYVLVDTELSSHSQHRSPATLVSPPASVDTSLEASSLHGPPVEEAFAVNTPDEAVGLASHCGPLLLEEGECEGNGGAAPRWQQLRRAGQALEALAGGGGVGPALAPAAAKQPGQCLSLCMAALQVLELALDAAAAEATEAAAAAVAAAAAQQQQQCAPGEAGAGLELPMSEDPAAAAATVAAAAAAAAAEARLQEDILRVLHKAEAAAALLVRAEGAASGPAPALGEEGAGGEALPDPWELCYQLALSLGKEAAVDELLGNQERSLQLYAQACCLLHFLSTVGPELPLEPPLRLGQQDRQRLQRYAAATSARWAACKAQLEAGGERGGAAGEGAARRASGAG